MFQRWIIGIIQHTITYYTFKVKKKISDWKLAPCHELDLTSEHNSWVVSPQFVITRDSNSACPLISHLCAKDGISVQDVGKEIMTQTINIRSDQLSQETSKINVNQNSSITIFLKYCVKQIIKNHRSYNYTRDIFPSNTYFLLNHHEMSYEFSFFSNKQVELWRP